MSKGRKRKYLQWLWEATRKPLVTKSYPPIVYIEPTNSCNLRCSHCARYTMKRGFSFLSIDKFEHILSQIEDFARVVYIFKQGEPLLNKNISYFIRRLREKNIYVILNTNATLLNRNRAEELLKSGLNLIEFSVDSWKKDTYRKIRGTDLADVSEKIVGFLKLKKDLGVDIMTRVRMVEQDLNRTELPETIEMLKRLPFDDIRINKLLNFFGHITGEVEGENTIKTKRQACSYPWKVISVNSDGNVTCILDYDNIYPYGNIFEKSFKEIWNDGPMLKIRSAFLSGRMEELKSAAENYCYICNARLKDDQKQPVDFVTAFCSYGYRFPDYYMPHLRMSLNEKEKKDIDGKYAKLNDTVKELSDYSGCDIKI